MHRFLFLAMVIAASAASLGGNWYEESFFLLHEDHHTQGQFEVGRDASLEQTARLVGQCKPDVVQIHAKGNPGWTTYPTEIGHTPLKLVRDVLAIWRDVARRDGYHFSAYYNIGRDGEIMSRRPEWNRVQADGRPVDKALCYHSGVAEGYLFPMIREIMARYRPDGFWFDGSCFTVQPCYCHVCRERFQRAQKLSPPTEKSERGWADYQEMQRQVYREFVEQTIAEIHKLDPKCLVAVNWAYSLRMPERPPAGLAYLTGDIGNRVEGLSPEAHYYDSQGLPFDLMTTVFTVEPSAEGNAAREMIPKPAGQIEQEMAVIVANGGRYFAWDNPTSTSGLKPERFELMAKVVARFLRARQLWCLGTRRMPDVSLLHSAAAHYAAGDQQQPSFPKRDNRIDGAAAALARLHLNYEIISDWRLAARDVRASLLLVEHPKVVTKETTAGVLKFLERGGRVLWAGMGLNPRLQEAFGVKIVAGASGPEPLNVLQDGQKHAFEHWLYRLECSSARTLIEVQSDDGKNYPLLTCHRVGRGLAFYVAMPLLTQHGKQSLPASTIEQIFATVLPPGDRLLTTTAPDTVEVVLRQQGSKCIVHLVNMAPGKRQEAMPGGALGKHRHVKITDIPPAPPCRVSIRLPARPKSVQLQPEGRQLTDWRYAEGRLEVEVPEFAIHQMVVGQASP